MDYTYLKWSDGKFFYCFTPITFSAIEVFTSSQYAEDIPIIFCGQKNIILYLSASGPLGKEQNTSVLGHRFEKPALYLCQLQNSDVHTIEKAASLLVPT